MPQEPSLANEVLQAQGLGREYTCHVEMKQITIFSHQQEQIAEHYHFMISVKVHFPSADLYDISVLIGQE